MGEPTPTIISAFTSVDNEARRKHFTAARGKPTGKLLARVTELSTQMEAAHSQAGPSMNMTKVDLGGLNSPVGEKVTALVGLHNELAGWQDALTEAQNLAAHADQIREANRGGGERDPQIDTILDEIAQRVSSTPSLDFNQVVRADFQERYGLEQLAGSELVRRMQDGGLSATIELADKRALNALFQTSAGWAPQSIRDPGFTPKASRPIQLIDIMPMVPTDQAAAVYMEETTRTTAAAAVAEGTAAPEATRAVTQKTIAIREIAAHIPVTMIEMEDVPQVEQYLTDDIPFEVRQAVDGLLVTGTGADPNPFGLNNVTGRGEQNWADAARTKPFDTLIDRPHQGQA